MFVSADGWGWVGRRCQGVGGWGVGGGGGSDVTFSKMNRSDHFLPFSYGPARPARFRSWCNFSSFTL